MTEITAPSVETDSKEYFLNAMKLKKVNIADNILQLWEKDGIP